MESSRPKKYISAENVARWFICRADKEFVDESMPEGITNLKLQKLLYFAQAVFLSVKKDKLFEDEIEAWPYGPVVPAVYRKYKSFANQVIEEKNCQFGDIEGDSKALLEDIWSVYGKYSAHELVNITHSHLPWRVAVESNSTKVISVESLREYYDSYYKLS